MKKHATIFAAAVFLATFPLSSCKKNEGKVIAKAGKTKVSEKDFARELSGLPPTYRNYVSTVEGKKQLIDILLREKILLDAAERSGVVKKADVQKSMKDYQERAKEQEQDFRKGLILREFLQQLQDKELKVTEAELKDYYDKNREGFEKPKKIMASHILTANEADAAAALARVRKGENFAKVAREASTDPSAENGGSIGEVSRGDLTELPDFEQALFGLKNGQISDVVKTKIGYHVIKKDGERVLPSQSFEQSAPQIRRVLEKKKFEEWIEKVKKENKVWIDEQALAAIQIPAAPAANEEAPQEISVQ